MSKSIFELVGNLDTLLAVAVGAVLATMGALVAELIQGRLNRKRRERDAARFFGEIMANMDRVLEAAIRSQGIGEPWGPVTRRLFRTALREAGVYERNRERLFDIRDMALRSRVHVHMVRKTFPVDAVIEYAADLDQLDDAVISGAVPPGTEQRERLDARAGRLREALTAGLNALQNEVQNTGPICADLEKLAGVRFGDVLANNAVGGASTNVASAQGPDGAGA